MLKTQIPIRTHHWDETLPGFVEADTVAHCGNSLAGDFVWSLTMTDIVTSWKTRVPCHLEQGCHGRPKADPGYTSKLRCPSRCVVSTVITVANFCTTIWCITSVTYPGQPAFTLLTALPEKR